MISFFDTLQSRARAIDSLLCVGLDPHPEDLPEPTPAAACDFCLRLIDTTAEQAAAFKPNSAFFEALGPAGLTALKEVIDAVPAGIPVILDAKRGDIASTARAYAQAVFEKFGASAVTLNPYLGRDAVAPFLKDPASGVFLLCKTSNPGAADLQDLHVRGPQSGGGTLYETVARLARGWNRHGNLGLVVGATQPKALARVRAAAPDLWILAPGVGAQGGDLEAALQAGLRADGFGLLVPVSRGIARAADPGAAAQALREAIQQARVRFLKGPLPVTVEDQQESLRRRGLAASLLRAGCVKFGQFTLKSGLQSPIYFDLRRLVTFPPLLEEVAQAYLPLLAGLQFDRLAALPYAALPIGTAISIIGGMPLLYPRKEVKAYGTKAAIEGVWEAGETVVVIDDLATTGGSKFEAIQKLTSAGLVVRDVVVLIDRQSGALTALAEAGYRFQAVFTLTELLDIWEAEGVVPVGDLAAAREFLDRSRPV